MGLNTWVNVVRGKMVAINRSVEESLLPVTRSMSTVKGQ